MEQIAKPILMTFDPEQLGFELPGESLDKEGLALLAQLKSGDPVDPTQVAATLERVLVDRADYRQMAYTDTLTHVGSAKLFDDCVRPLLERCVTNTERRQDAPDNYIVAIADLNGLKEVNDTIGYDAGDALIRAAADRINQLLRKEDIVTRHGEKADEFILVLPITGIESAFDAIKDVIGRRLNGDGLSIAVGFALLKDYLSVEEALAAAQEAMKLDKAARKAAKLALDQFTDADIRKL